MSRPYTTACAGCAEKLNRLYYMDEIEGSERAGLCAWCQQYRRIQQFAYSPRRPRYSRPGNGGGERNRAGSQGPARRS